MLCNTAHQRSIWQRPRSNVEWRCCAQGRVSLKSMTFTVNSACGLMIISHKGFLRSALWRPSHLHRLQWQWCAPHLQGHLPSSLYLLLLLSNGNSPPLSPPSHPPSLLPSLHPTLSPSLWKSHHNFKKREKTGNKVPWQMLNLGDYLFMKYPHGVTDCPTGLSSQRGAHYDSISGGRPHFSGGLS